MMLCCGLFLVAPLVGLLTYVAVTRQVLILAVASLLVSAVPLFVILLVVSDYRPSDDPDVQMDQGTGWRAVWFYAGLVQERRTLVGGLYSHHAHP